jgi:uncharacterized protein
MISRFVQTYFQQWKTKKSRKPLILRGARQVGKTTAVHEFSGSFDQYIYLNLELAIDAEPFQKYVSIEQLIEQIFFIKNKDLEKRSKTLIFIDEIQEVPEALNTLRYFYENAKDIYVIAAGSLLEFALKQNIRFPVGRVEYCIMRPISFPEFMDAMEESLALKAFHTVPAPAYTIDKLMRLFHTYTLIGGMPEIVQHYATNRDLGALRPFYESILQTYMDDVEKYTNNNTELNVARLCMRASLNAAGSRITFDGFGNSNYKSREVGDALRMLEKTMLVQLIYPHSEVKIPMQPNYKKSPKLHVLDTGLVNYFFGVQKEIIATAEIDKVYQGKILEHLVGQELLTTTFEPLHHLNFWTREKKSSQAEMDYVINWKSRLIPIEVKSGATGKLKSLHAYMEESEGVLAVRVHSGALEITPITTQNGKEYFLMSIPYCMVTKIEEYMAWFEGEVEKIGSSI